MSKNEEKKVSYVCALYGGVMKQSITRFVVFDKPPAEECEQYKALYGSDLKARFVKTKVSSQDAFKTLKDYLALQDNAHLFEDLYGLPILKAMKLMRDALKVKKSFKWNSSNEEEDEEEGEEEGEDEAEAEGENVKEQNTSQNQSNKNNKTNQTTQAAAKPAAKKVVVKGKKEEPKEIDVEQEDEVVEAPVAAAPKKETAKTPTKSSTPAQKKDKAPVAKK